MIAKNKIKVGPQIKVKKTKKYAFLPLMSAVSLWAGVQGATQFFAHSFNYHDVLGGHINYFYAPWKIFQWALKWYGQYPDQFMQSGSFGVMVASVGLLIIAVTKVVVNNSAKNNDHLHGSARWANKDDIVKAGLLSRKQTVLERVTGKDIPTSMGVYVGGWEDKDGKFHYLRHSGPEHVLTYAPTRSGKGVGLVIPTLLSWPQSTIISDLKGELWALTAGWRKKYAKNKVLKFEPASQTEGVCWNPLDEVRLGAEFEVGDVQNLASLIVDPDGKGLSTHWQKTSFSLLVGVLLHILYKAKNGDGKEASLPLLDAVLADPDRDVGELWMDMVSYGHVDGENHIAVGAAARDMLDRPDEEAGSVLSTAKSYLALYRDPIVARNVSKSDFSLMDLMNNDDPVSLYIITKPTDKTRLRPLVRIMINMSIRLLSDGIEFEGGRPKATYKHKLLMMLDEFPSLGKLEIMQESLAFLAGYGIKCYLICQDITQLKSRENGYGADETITSNCHIQNAYPPNRIETAEYLSRITGQATVIKEQITTSGKRASVMMGNVSRTTQEVQRNLLTADECLRMPGPKKTADGSIEEPGDMVIYVAGYPAIYGKQPLYFKDPIFQARAEIPEPRQSDTILSHHEEIEFEFE